MQKILCLLGLHLCVRDAVVWKREFFPNNNKKIILRQCMDCGKVIYINTKI